MSHIKIKMPQLDANTFLIQFISLIFSFILTYAFVVYIFLPLTLRASLLRNKIVVESTLVGLNKTLISVKIKAEAIVGKTKIVFYNLQNFKVANIVAIGNSSSSHLAQRITPNTAASYLSRVRVANYFVYLFLLLAIVPTKTKKVKHSKKFIQQNEKIHKI